MREQKFISYVVLIVMLFGCTTGEKPVEQYILAKTAYDAAAGADASKYAARLLYRSEKHYKRGEALFKDRYYQEADQEFKMAQKYAERAETISRLKQFQAAGGGNY